MSAKVTIKDGKGNGGEACVTRRNQLIVAPLDFSLIYNVKAELVNTAYNIVPPETGKAFVVTDLIVYANKSVGAADATVVIYASDGPNSLTEVGVFFTQEMVKQTTLTMTGLNIFSPAGLWINVKTDDDDIFVNMAGYYVDA
jgi:hypothetical protein